MLPNLATVLTVVATNDYEYVVTFLGPAGALDQPLLTVANNSLVPAAARSPSPKPCKGITANDTLRFAIEFAGPAGGQDQPLLIHGDRLSGVTHLKLEEIVRGNTGEFRVNNQIANTQSLSRAAIDGDGNFVDRLAKPGSGRLEPGHFRQAIRRRRRRPAGRPG